MAADLHVRDWFNSHDVLARDQCAQDIAGSLELGTLSPYSLLQELEPFLNEDATLIQAGEGMDALAEILNYVEEFVLGRQDLHMLVEYLCSRLENRNQIPNNKAGVSGCARSLLRLSKMTGRFPKADASVVARAIFSLTSTTLRDQKPSTRLNLYELLHFLLQTYSSPLTRDMDPQLFVESLTGMSAIEKDPKCLRLLFQMYELISETWTLTTDDFNKTWESFSKYWPISFKDVPSDTSIPTTTELNLLIQNCFTSHDNYATLAFEHLLTVLDASQDTITTYTKNTVLEAFAACFNAYSVDTAAVYSSRIWDNLKFEVWDGTNDEFIERTEKVLFAIAKKLDTGNLSWQSSTTPLAQFTITSSTECSERLHDSKLQHVLGSGRILRAIGSASHLALDLVIRNVVPRILLMWDDKSIESKRTSLLSVFNHLLQARLDLLEEVSLAASNPFQDTNVLQNLQDNEALVSATLTKFKHSLVDDVYIKAMAEMDTGMAAADTAFQINTIKGLVLGARIPSFLSDCHKGTIVSGFVDRVLDRHQTQEVHDEAVRALLQIHIDDPKLFLDITVAKFTAALPKSMSNDTNISKEELAGAIFVLEAFSQVSCAKLCQVETDAHSAESATRYKFRVFDGFQTALMKKLFAIVELKNQLGYASAILATMFRGLQMFDEALSQEKVAPVASASSSDFNPYAWIILELYKKLIEPKKDVAEIKPTSEKSASYMGFSFTLNGDAKSNDLFVSLLGKITTLALRSRQTTPGNNFLINANNIEKPSQVWLLFSETDLGSSIAALQSNLVDGPPEKCLVNVLSMSLVAGVRREHRQQIGFNVGQVALQMIKNATSIQCHCSSYARIAMLQFLQLLVNKFGAAKETLQNEKRSLTKFMIDMTATPIDATNTAEAERIYQAVAYFAAAALAAGDNSDWELISQMLKGLEDPEISLKVAQSFRILLAPSSIMSKENFCVLRKLSKQRLYNMTVDKIIGQWRRVQKKDQRENFLIALAGVFAYMEPSILEQNVTDIFPAILEGATVQDENAMFTCISLLKGLIVTCPQVVTEHARSITSRMTDRTRNTYSEPSDASPRCRAAALEVLSLMTDHVEGRTLLPLKECGRAYKDALVQHRGNWQVGVDFRPLILVDYAGCDLTPAPQHNDFYKSIHDSDDDDDSPGPLSVVEQLARMGVWV